MEKETKKTIIVATSVVTSVAVLSVLAVDYVWDRTVRSFNGIFTLNTAAPTKFYPNTVAFCSGLEPSGLQGLVDNAAQGGTELTAGLLALNAATIHAPTTSIRAAMLTLYNQVKEGHFDSTTAANAIQTVKSQNPCGANI